MRPSAILVGGRNSLFARCGQWISHLLGTLRRVDHSDLKDSVLIERIRYFHSGSAYFVQRRFDPVSFLR